jgi:hypothetical protein
MADSRVTLFGDKRLRPDEALLAECRVETFRGPGPGGQKRNKTSSAVRITNAPSGLAAVAGESRSQSQNKSTALRRLRRRMAIELREPLDLQSPRPDWFRINVAQKNDLYAATVGLVLDALAAADWALAPARQWLGVNASQLIKFLQDDPEAWAAVQKARAAKGLHPLR